MCNGQLLSIEANTALFSLLGTFYGGNGENNFALPNLQGTAPTHVGSGFTQGQVGGEARHTLITTEMPEHTHAVSARAAGSTSSPDSAMWATSSKPAYVPPAAGGIVTMRPNAIGPAGGSQPHDNMPPYLVLNYCIALVGIFPPRS
jgi:microcystin-dependent protein